MQTSKNIKNNSTAGTSTLAEERSFDAWGRLRNPTNWSYTLGTTGVSTGKLSLTNRGFTGHEHLPSFGIINMNGRVYDPVVARFLSADDKNIVPISTQHFNRYSYVLNNPLKYTDPSGWNWKPIGFSTFYTSIPYIANKIENGVKYLYNKLTFKAEFELKVTAGPQAEIKRRLAPNINANVSINVASVEIVSAKATVTGLKNAKGKVETNYAGKKDSEGNRKLKVTQGVAVSVEEEKSGLGVGVSVNREFDGYVDGGYSQNSDKIEAKAQIATECISTEVSTNSDKTKEINIITSKESIKIGVGVEVGAKVGFIIEENK